MFTEKNILDKLSLKFSRSSNYKFRKKLKGKGSITLSSVLENAIVMQAGLKGGRVKFIRF